MSSKIKSVRLFSPLLAATLLLFLVGMLPPVTAAEKYPAGDAGAQALLSEFLKPAADVKTLSKQLQPTKADYEAIYSPTLASKLIAMYEPVWASGALVITPKPDQTELKVQSVPSAEVRQWTPKASAILPGGYKQISPDIKDGFTVYAFKFVKPGEQLGMAWDGLTYVNGHWCIFPKPWRALAAN